MKKNNTTINEHAKTLVCMYNYIPDTSGIVAAKRIYQNKEKVDLIHNKQPKDEFDTDFNNLVSQYIEDEVEIDTLYRFNYGNHSKEFIKKSLKEIEKLTSRKGQYNKVYSRALFAISHFLAFEYKLKNPNVKWIAEFSDPMLYDSNGEKRESKLDKESANRLNDIIKNKGFKPHYDNDNYFFYAEYIPYLFADKIVFINENQRSIMLNSLPTDLKDSVIKKSIVLPHPILDKEVYYLKNANYNNIDKNKVNLAYFGRFYDKRKPYSILSSLYALDDKIKEKCVIHLFLPNKDEYQKLVDCMPLNKDNIIINDYYNYLEFLNLLTKFDCLICPDTKTDKHYPYNPYLPSKVSDYLGSQVDIWGIYEKNSPINKMDEIKYKSDIDNLKSIEETLKHIIQDKIDRM
ncbi:MAG: hypothetical protein ACOX01_04860 [Methanobrevibacter boviskoreani]|uniref:hypothetical protein n=1 Tax=Methanobrevibacter boviskoreani TaxID=1348249 RepID=UPI003D8B738A